MIKEHIGNKQSSELIGIMHWSPFISKDMFIRIEWLLTKSYSNKLNNLEYRALFKSNH